MYLEFIVMTYLFSLLVFHTGMYYCAVIYNNRFVQRGGGCLAGPHIQYTTMYLTWSCSI